ncbi:DUF4126 domain-containing protein [Chitinophagaceae bacterium LB-8]|uniref:DUF4126 domain-containing protein n=1 Tax=Paraflavisolibacter caeni TaxID=2982496 RepID=A0A9X2Y1E5_9BACT|nr:DUF4126 domain-containing protein [Paraflavisolibacter caeni]MCU7552752.1 DUF4126 domain-containing protein [Paraflavisolibacter caeni]
MDTNMLTQIAMGIALSACAGFRVFLPMLTAALATQLGWIHLPSDMHWLGSWAAIICFGTAAILEVIAYYIPFVDNLLDTIATPLSVAAGTMLAFSILPVGEQEPLIRWGLALLAGGSAAGTIQLGTGILRLLSSKTTAGTGNAIVATTENAAAASGSVLSLFIPVIMAVLLLFLIVWILVKLFSKVSSISRKKGSI